MNNSHHRKSTEMQMTQHIKILSKTPFSDNDIETLHDAMVTQGLPVTVPLPADFVSLVKQHGMTEITLLDTPTAIKYVQLGGVNAKDMLENQNTSVSFISYPALVIGINGMGQSILYAYKDKRIALYVAQDGNFGDDDELVYLSETLTQFINDKENLDKLA